MRQHTVTTTFSVMVSSRSLCIQLKSASISVIPTGSTGLGCCPELRAAAWAAVLIAELSEQPFWAPLAAPLRGMPEELLDEVLDELPEELFRGRILEELFTGKLPGECVTGRLLAELLTGKLPGELRIGRLLAELLTGKLPGELRTARLLAELLTGKLAAVSSCAAASKGMRRFLA